MKIVVIGATGTIGKSVSKKLKENNHEVIEVGSKSGDYQLDITSPTEIEQMYKDAIKDKKTAKKEKVEMAPTVTINGKMVEDPLDKNDLFKKLNKELKK